MASTYGIVGRVGVLVEPTFKDAQKKVRDGLGKPIAQEAPKQGVDLGNAIVNGTTRAFKWGGLAAGAALGTAITKGFGRLRAMEDATAKIEGLGYAASEVDQIMTDVQGALDGTMFLYSEGADVAAGALAAGVQQGEELEGYLRLTADAATQAGIDFGTMGEVMNKVEGDGRLMGDTVQQLAQNGVYILPALAEEFGVTGEEMRKMVSNGEVDAETFRRIMEEQYGGSSERAAETMTGAMSLAWTAVGQLGERLISEVYPYLRDFFQGFYDWVQEISPKVEEFGRVAGEMLGSVIGWMVDNPGAVKAFAAAIGAVAAAFVGYTAAVKVAKTWTTIMDTATGLLNGTIRLNPIGLWVAAISALVVGLIWAWNNVDWFRDAVVTAWDWITNAFTWAWEKVIEPVIDWIVDAWNWLADMFVKVWENYLSPVFDTIGTVVMWLWDNIFEPYIGYVTGLWMSLGEVFMWVWENVLSHVFAAIGDIAVWLWENVLQPVFTWIGDHWHYVVDAMAWVWEYILKPVWDAIAFVAVWLWETVLEPVFSWIGEHWSTVMDIMKWAWDYILKPVWDAIVAVATWLWEKILEPIFTWIGDHWDTILEAMRVAWEEVLRPAWDKLVEIAEWLWYDILEPIFRWIGNKWSEMSDTVSDVYNDHIKPIFDKFGGIVEDLKDKFKTGVDNIKEQWDKLKSIAADPVKFVIVDIFNDGLINTLNKIPGVNIPDVPVPKWADEYADGGWTGPGGKYEPAGIVHADEYVVRKASRGRFERENPGLLDHINKYGTMAGYASGGLVTPVQGPLTSRFGPRGGGTHAGVDWAVPVGTPVRAALTGTVARAGWNIVTGRTGIGVLLAHEGNRNTYYGHLSRLAVRVGDTVRQGQGIGLSGNTGRSTGPHLHFETWTGGRPVDPLSHMGGLPASADGGSGWFDPLAPFRALGEKIKSSIADKFPGAGYMIDAAAGIAKQGFDDLLEWAKSKIPGLGDPDDGSGGVGMGAAGSAAARSQVKGVAARYGWDSGAQWNALDDLIQAESSWNPNAANPNSTARGLFQKMTSIHGPVESTAAGQAEWGLDYIADRYGSPLAAVMHHKQRGWYADGGHVTPLFRDRGGNLPPGLSMVLNNTGRDETILPDTPRNVEAAFLRQGAGAGVHIHGDVWAHSPEQVAQEIHKDARRAAALAPVL